MCEDCSVFCVLRRENYDIILRVEQKLIMSRNTHSTQSVSWLVVE